MEENTKGLKGIYIIIFLMGLVLVGLLIIVLMQYMNDAKFVNVPHPVQTRTSGSIIKSFNGVNVGLNKVANYKVEGRVVDTYDYAPDEKGIYDTDSMLNAVSHRDIGLSWGFLAEGTNHRKVIWNSIGNRHLEFTAGTDFLNKHGGMEEVTKHWSNNHLIASDDKIYEDIQKIKVGDYILIEGHLVNLMCELTANTFIKYNTSTVRTDKGTGACEVIYVTKVEWK
ncbi:MAG: hypothetical protein IKL08_03615 [Clostridia bacterium]|nr:hypothetical protein [Clostridia bacterium]